MKLILRSFRCLLLWIVILSRAFGIAMVMIHAIIVNVIRVISRSTGLFRRWDHTLWGLDAVPGYTDHTPIFVHSLHPMKGSPSIHVGGPIPWLAVFLNPRSLSAAAAKVFMADDGILPGCGLPRGMKNRLFPTDTPPREQSHAEGINVYYIICHDRGPCGCCHSTLATSHGVISPTPHVWSAGQCFFGR